VPDVVDPATRSRMMAGIRGKNTKPELVIRRGLHRRGYRYRLHCKDLPGKPDLCFPRRRAAVFVHGCFWHGHQCRLFKWPSTRPEFWREKIYRNVAVDERARMALTEMGWRVLIVWECAMRGPGSMGPADILEIASKWLDRGTNDLELRGQELADR